MKHLSINNNLKIIPINETYLEFIDLIKNSENNYPFKKISSTYLHGKLKKDCNYDIFYFLGKNIPNKEGIYPCYFENKKCLAFIWNVPTTLNLGMDYEYSDSFNSSSRFKGLVIYENDEEGKSYALNCYTKKQYII